MRQARQANKIITPTSAFTIKLRPQGSKLGIRLPRFHSRKRCAHRLGAYQLRVSQKLVVAQVEHLAHSTHDARVQQRTARKRQRLFDRKAAHDGSLERLDGGVAQALQDILDGHTFLLAMDDIGFREHAATPR